VKWIQVSAQLPQVTINSLSECCSAGLLPLPTRRTLCDRSCCRVYVSFHELDYWKSNKPVSLKLGVMTRPTNRKSWLTVGGDSVPDMDSRSIWHFSPLLQIYSHTVTAWYFTKPGEMTDAEKAINRQHVGRDSADIQIQIWINPAIRIGILDQVWLKFWHWWRFTLPEQHSPVIVTIILLLLFLL